MYGTGPGGSPQWFPQKGQIMSNFRILFQYSQLSEAKQVYRRRHESRRSPKPKLHQKNKKTIIMPKNDVYRATRMHSADYAVARCLSVRHTPVLCLNDFTSSKFFHCRVVPLFQFFNTKRDGNIPTGTPLTGASNGRGYEKSRSSTNISLYLANNARQSHSYYGRRIGKRTKAFEWYQFE